MFDISWGEFLVVGIVALIVIGPQQLPGALRGLGRTVNKLRNMAGDFRAQFDDAMREAELQDVARDVSDIKSAASGGFNPVETIRNEIRSAVDGIKDKASETAGVKDAQAAIQDVDSTLKAAEYHLQAAQAIDAMVAPPAPAPAFSAGIMDESPKEAGIAGVPDSSSPAPKKRRSKKSAPPSEPEGAGQ